MYGVIKSLRFKKGLSEYATGAFYNKVRHFSRLSLRLSRLLFVVRGNFSFNASHEEFLGLVVDEPYFRADKRP